MQLFLAIDPPAEVKQSIEKQLAPLKSQYPYFRWVDLENLHATLQFFGNNGSDPDKIVKWMNELVFNMPSFSLYSSNLGLFIKDNLTFYIGFHKNRFLESLVKGIKEKSELGISGKFISHLTIGRYKIPSKQQYLLIKKKLKNFSLNIEFKVERITLFEIVLGTPKPVYKKIAEFPLLDEN